MKQKNTLFRLCTFLPVAKMFKSQFWMLFLNHIQSILLLCVLLNSLFESLVIDSYEMKFMQVICLLDY